MTCKIWNSNDVKEKQKQFIQWPLSDYYIKGVVFQVILFADYLNFKSWNWKWFLYMIQYCSIEWHTKTDYLRKDKQHWTDLKIIKH